MHDTSDAYGTLRRLQAYGEPPRRERRPLSKKQREILERDALILEKARQILLERGYYGLTMDRLADASDCPKGTMYQRFGCKEDIVLALAAQCLGGRVAMMQRGTAYDGRARERMAALGEAVGLHSRLNPDDSRILHIATGPIREKGSTSRLATVAWLEKQAIDLVRQIIEDAKAQGDLMLKGEATAEELAFALWALVDGSYTLVESGIPQAALGITDPFYRTWRVYNSLADSYGWQPLFQEWDWEETLANVRRKVFPDESQQLYGKNAWYGDGR